MNKLLEKSILELETNLSVNIKQSLLVQGVTVVRVDRDVTIKYGDNSIDRNVYAFNDVGKKIWQIEEAPIKNSPKPYMSIKIVDGNLIASNWSGFDVSINLKTGAVTPYNIGQRPW